MPITLIIPSKEPNFEVVLCARRATRMLHPAIFSFKSRETPSTQLLLNAENKNSSVKFRVGFFITPAINCRGKNINGAGK